LGGLRGFFKIPDLKTFRTENKGKIGINYAELVFPVDADQVDTVNFFVPGRLSVEYFYGSSVGQSLGRDDNIGATYFNGFFNKKTMEYRVNITEFIHSYLQGFHNYNSFFLNSAVVEKQVNSRVDYKKPGRVPLNSGLGANPPYLRIVYTSTDL
jgi:hypothetical protein